MDSPQPPYPPPFLDGVQRWAQMSGEAWPAEAEPLQLLQPAPSQPSAAPAARALWRQTMQQLHASNPALAQTLRLRFEESQTIRSIGRRMHRSPASVHRDLQSGLQALADILWRQESDARQRFIAAQTTRLESPSYDELFGVQPLARRLMQVVQEPTGPGVILLSGAGGLGKTSLADFLSRELIAVRAFRNFGWVSLRPQISLWDPRPHFQPASQQQALETLFETLARQILGADAIPAPFSLPRLLQRLAHRLQREPNFIVIDNLETLAQPALLVDAIAPMAGRSRFLLTSRRSLPAQPRLYHQQTPPLSPQAAIALLRSQGRTRHVQELERARDADLRRIHQKVGGNPLALKLVAGQLHLHALETVLDDLSLARGRSVGRLYNYIYQRAWADLDDAARQTLLAMPLLPPDGGPLPQISAITGLPEATVHDALETLVQRNLVDSPRAAAGGLYRIHELTRTFLQQPALAAQPGPDQLTWPIPNPKT